MELRRELSVMMGGLVILNVLLAFGVIGLLVRMGPAIDRILQENVYSIVAAEEVLAAIAESTQFASPASARARIEDALGRARRNVTEPAEAPVLESIASEVDATLAGDAAARARLVSGVRELIRINRDAMRDVDREAQRLGRAGAWAAVLVGVLSFGLSLMILGRLRRRLVAPLLELHAVLEAARQGERFRRCHPRDAPLEVRQVLEAVNGLLDERVRHVLAADREP